MDENAEAGTDIVEQPKINPITGRPWTDEERRAQSERAKRQVAEGTFGGSVAGRKKKTPAYAAIAAVAQNNGHRLGTTLLAIATGENTTDKNKLDAIKLLVDIELKAKANRRAEEDHLMSMPKDDLQRLVLERISQITGEDYDIEIGPEEVQEDGYQG